MKPAPIIVRMIRVGKARELERAARQAEAVIARDPHLAGVEEAHAKQLAIVLVRERQELRHGRGGYSVSDDSGGDQAHEQGHRGNDGNHGAVAPGWIKLGHGQCG